MRRSALSFLPLLATAVAMALLCRPVARAAESGPDLLPTVGSIERLDPRFDSLVPPGAVIEVLASGFAWSEGPVWVTSDKGGLPTGSLLFSDIPHNRIHRWQPGKGLGMFMEPAGFTDRLSTAASGAPTASRSTARAG
jgi:gluconolactonase